MSVRVVRFSISWVLSFTFSSRLATCSSRDCLVKKLLKDFLPASLFWRVAVRSFYFLVAETFWDSSRLLESKASRKAVTSLT